MSTSQRTGIRRREAASSKERALAGTVKVEHWNADVEGALTQEALCRKLEERGYSVAVYVYPPRTVFPDHVHAVDKIDGVVSGRFRMAMRGKAVVLDAGDCLEVPAGTVHSAEVVGNDPVISVDAVKRVP